MGSTSDAMPWLHVLIDVPARVAENETRFWSGVLGWEPGPMSEGHPELRSFEPPAGDSHVHLQEVDDSPRVHLDLEAADPAEAVRRALEAGAEVTAARSEWTTLASPGGLPFCVVSAPAHRPSSSSAWSGGHRSRLVQLCIDSPNSRRDVELTFWRTLLPGGRWEPSGSPEFDGKWFDDDGGPIQVLFQGLDEDDGPVRAHIDLGTDDREAEVTRLLALGAGDVGPGAGWHTLTDPAGLPFCVTDNVPDRSTRGR